MYRRFSANRVNFVIIEFTAFISVQNLDCSKYDAECRVLHDRQCTFNLTLSRIRATILAVEKQ